ncbi:hypothetical protein BHE74_00049677, partial [Ensete ventricosum]
MGTYRSVRLPVRRPLATGRFRQKSTVGGSISTVDGRLREKSTADGRLREKSTVGRRLSEKKGRRRRRGKEEKKKRGKKKEYLALACRPRPRAVAARTLSSLTRRRHPRVPSTRA